MSPGPEAVGVQWEFGLAPLPGATDYARAVRSLTEVVLALDAPSERLDRLVREIRAVDGELRREAAVTPGVRIGEHAADPRSRPYLDHSTDVGAFNPMFPEYDFAVADEERASGTVTFSIVHEGPPGLVHGGFLAVFFDAITSEHGCRIGLAGKTKTLAVRYRRPTPVGVALDFAIDRRVAGAEIDYDATLSARGELLCAAQARTVAGRREGLPRVGARIR